MKKALITGITGQDGSYLAEFLLSKGYEVHGIVRRASTFNRERINHLSEPGTYTSDSDKFHFYLHYGDLTDSSSIEEILKKVMPDEVYNLGAQSHVRISFDVPENTVNVVALGTLRILEGIRKICPNTRFYQASSSEMFGKVLEIPQTEKTPFYPRSPYGRAKVFAYWETIGAREAHGLHASNGILFNHESERRSESFVTRKITRSLARIKLGLQNKLSLGNLDAKRDWGHSKDFVEAMWLIVQQDKPGDYVIGTGESHSVREFLEETANVLGLKIHSNGKQGIEEKYLNEEGKVIVEIDPQYFRPTEVDLLLSNPEKAKKILNWEPKIKFKDLVKLMAEHDLKLAQNEFYLREKNKESSNNQVKDKNNINIQEINKCRICGNTDLISIFDLGNQYLSGRFPSKDESFSLKAPLHLVKCNDNQNNSACGLLQLKHTTDLNEMYGKTYGYRSGLNESMVEHLRSIVISAERIVNLLPGDVVLDIGSSDATLLKMYHKMGIKKIGIDPAAEKFKEYYSQDIDLITNFFSAEKFKQLYGDKKAKIITSIAMFYDLEEPMKFVEDIKEILHPEGIWICEQSYMPKMLEVNSFYTICHEHLEYYSLKQFEWMLNKTGLKIFDIEFNNINGGSFKVYICHNNNPIKINFEKLNEVRNYEKNLGLDTDKQFNEFKERVMKFKNQLRNFLVSEKLKGKNIHVYGASTKGNVLLQFFDINHNLIDIAADRNNDKWGKLTPGTNIPIFSEEESRKNNPDYFLVLPWHFKEEFIKREENFLRNGGKFIFPLPQPEIVYFDPSIGMLKSHIIGLQNFNNLN